jgi:hypothetical protein
MAPCLISIIPEPGRKRKHPLFEFLQLSVVRVERRGHMKFRQMHDRFLCFFVDLACSDTFIESFVGSFELIKSNMKKKNFHILNSVWKFFGPSGDNGFDHNLLTIGIRARFSQKIVV